MLFRSDQSSDDADLGKKKGRALGELTTTLLRSKRQDILELDELWSFVWSKKCVRWVWIALCRRTRQVVAYFIGDRSGASCRAFWERIPASYKRGFTFSDYWKTYKQVIQTGRHFSVGRTYALNLRARGWADFSTYLRGILSIFVDLLGK